VTNIRTTVIRNGKTDEFRQEKLCTFDEYVNFGRAEAGQRILLGQVDADGRSFNTETFWVGDHFNADYIASICDLFVLEVTDFS